MEVAQSTVQLKVSDSVIIVSVMTFEPLF